MHIARSLAAVLAAGALALTGCAGDDLSNDNASDDASSSGGAPRSRLSSVYRRCSAGAPTSGERIQAIVLDPSSSRW